MGLFDTFVAFFKANKNLEDAFTFDLTKKAIDILKEELEEELQKNPIDKFKIESLKNQIEEKEEFIAEYERKKHEEFLKENRKNSPLNCKEWDFER